MSYLTKNTIMSKELKEQTLVMTGMEGAMNEDLRGERLQLMLTGDELKALDNFRFSKRMPSRAAAVRELLKRGLAAEGFLRANADTKSSDFGILEPTKRGDEAGPGEK